ncbi:hypothetical protein [Flavobacterium sp. W22_SRS_FP1]|uniref:hypothetical protein n=1 Tax=Flavobacterium sp. W22_SRS_FP1 TaxID=3240276 RepID=UPI003F8EC030
MSANLPQYNPEDQEIDLILFFKKIGDFFQWLNTLLFRIIRFFVKNKIVMSALLIIGFGLGLYLDKTQKTYDHRIIATPNFKSTDYLYSKINLLNAKIIEGNTAFLTDSVGLKNPEILKGIKIKPITDVYKFIENKNENFELIKLMAEAGDINKILEDNMTSKNYTNHEIIIKTDKLASDELTIQPILNFLNESDYFKKIQIEEFKNAQIKLSQNDTIISQIDAVLNGFSSSVNRNQQSDKLVYYNENTQLNDVIKTKEALIYQQGVLRVDLVGMDKIIKENSATLNIENTSSINGKLKFVLPVLFLCLFIFIHLFMTYYKSQMKKAQLI